MLRIGGRENYTVQTVIMEDQGIFASPYGKLAGVEIEGGDHSVVISVVENRAREISICKIDTQSVGFCYVYCSQAFALILNDMSLIPELLAGDFSFE